MAVIDGIKEKLPRCRELLPDDVSVTVIQDQSRYIVEALHEIERHLVSGSILACLTVLVFMRSWRSTLIAAVAIPASIIGSFAFMKAFGFTLNNVTMLALVLMVGVVIDDAIVVLENVFHCIEEKGMEPKEAAIDRDERNRHGGLRDDHFISHRVPAGVVHLQRDRTDVVSVWRDGHGCDPDLDVGQLFVDADDVQQTFASEQR